MHKFDLKENQISSSVRLISSNSLSLAKPCWPIVYSTPFQLYFLSFRLPTKGKSTGDVRPQKDGSPYHIYSLMLFLFITDFISAPNESISTFILSFTRKYLMACILSIIIVLHKETPYIFYHKNTASL